jgi:hypothetical protein
MKNKLYNKKSLISLVVVVLLLLFTGVSYSIPPFPPSPFTGGTVTRATTFEAAVTFKTKPWIDVKAYGAVCDDSTNDATALQAAITAMAAGDTLYIPGICRTATELSFAGKSNIRIIGNEFLGSRITYTGSGRSAVSLLGASSVTMRDLEILTSNSGSAPKAALILGRTSAASFGTHRFERVSVRGYATQALVYNVASELNSFDNVFFTLDGGGALHTYYQSEQDDLGLTGFTNSSCLSNMFTHSVIVNTSTNASASGIYIYARGATGHFTFKDGYIAAAGGSAIEIFAVGATGPFDIQAVRGESYSGTGYAYFLKLSGDYIYDVFVKNCDSSNVYETNFIYAVNSHALYTSSFEDNKAAHASSLYDGSYIFIRDSGSSYAFRSQANNSMGLALGTNTINLGSSAGNPNFIWSGGMITGTSQQFGANAGTAAAFTIKGPDSSTASAAGGDLILSGGNPGAGGVAGKVIITGAKGYPWIPAGSMTPITSAGLATVSQAPNMTDYLAFDGATDEYAGFTVSLEDWDLGTIKAKFVWYASASMTNGHTVIWGLNCYAVSDGDTSDVAFDTGAVTVSDAYATSDETGPIQRTSAATAAITVQGTPVAGDVVYCRVSRDADTDTSTIDAWLVGVKIEYGKTTPTAW